jgi:hypothetical protein
MKSIALAATVVLIPVSGWAWGPEGHAIVAEIAQRRLNDAAREAISTILRNVSPALDHASLASFASWADDYRVTHPGTTNWHFVAIPLNDDLYNPAQQCKLNESKGDCIIAELDRLKSEIRCTTGEDQFNALKLAVHFVGDIQQPLHTVDEELGGNNIFVEVRMRGLACTGSCEPTSIYANFHAVWDTVLIQKTAFAWGSYVERLESDWLRFSEALGVDGGTPADWALEAHKIAQSVWRAKPANNILDDAYYQKVLPLLDRQLSVGGLRLASFLNEAFGANSCPAR